VLHVQQFDGVILDITMPGMNGLEVLSHLKEEHPQLCVIMVTAAESRDQALLAVHAGAQAYLLKPFETGQLVTVITQCMGAGKTHLLG
jgi:DNA-binding response OmpR family regulator